MGPVSLPGGRNRAGGMAVLSSVGGTDFTGLAPSDSNRLVMGPCRRSPGSLQRNPGVWCLCRLLGYLECVHPRQEAGVGADRRLLVPIRPDTICRLAVSVALPSETPLGGHPPYGQIPVAGSRSVWGLYLLGRRAPLALRIAITTDPTDSPRARSGRTRDIRRSARPGKEGAGWAWPGIAADLARATPSRCGDTGCSDRQCVSPADVRTPGPFPTCVRRHG